MPLRWNVCVVAYLSFTVTSLAQMSPQCSTPGLPGGMSEIVIDARTGAATGKRSFRKSDQVRIAVINKNPFVYEYKLKIDEKTVDESALGAFLGLLGIPTISAPPPRGNAQQGPHNGKSVCTDPLATAINQLHSRLDSAGLGSKVKEAGDALEKAKGAYSESQPKLNTSNAKCDALTNEATTLSTALTAYSPPSTDLKQRSASAKSLAEAELSLIKQLPPDCQEEFNDKKTDAQKVITVAYALSAIDIASAQVVDANKKLTKVLNDPSAFASQQVIGPYQDRTNATISLQRKSASDSDFKAVSTDVSLNFGGGPRFIVSGGVAGSLLTNTQFGRVQGFELNRNGTFILDGSGQPIIGTIVGVTEDSKRVTPLLMLNAMLCNSPSKEFPVSLAWSLGITAKADKGVNVEFLTGPTIGLLDDWMFLTVGPYIGKTQTLTSGFYVGAPVPKDVTDIPVTKRWGANVGFALTFKIPTFGAKK